MLAAHSTCVSPNSTSTEPSACFAKRRVKLTRRSSSAARPLGLAICFPNLFYGPREARRPCKRRKPGSRRFLLLAKPPQGSGRGVVTCGARPRDGPLGQLEERLVQRHSRRTDFAGDLRVL